MDRRLTGFLGILGIGAAIVLTIFLLRPVMKSSAVRQGQEGPETDTGASSASVKPGLRGKITVSIASSNTKQDWLHEAVAAFNAASPSREDLQVDGKFIAVDILQETIDGKKVDYRSGTMVADTLAGRIKPAVLSPGEEVWITKFAAEWKAINGTNVIRGESPVVARTPLVLAMWQSRARALGCFPTSGPECTWERVAKLAASPEGWKLAGRPQWGKFTLGYGYFDQSNSGTLGIVAMCTVGAKKPAGMTIADVDKSAPCGNLMAMVEKGKVHSGKSDVWLLEKMVRNGQEYLNVVITYESNVIATNRKFQKDMAEPLVAVYPQDGTFMAAHPYAVLENASWVTTEQASAAHVFEKFLLAAEQQEALMRLGLRPANPQTKLASPIDLEFGVNPHAKLVTLPSPDLRVWNRIGEVWHEVKKPAVVILVFDKSGSMKDGGKIAAARKGAMEFVERMHPVDYLVWMPFDEKTYADGTRGYKYQMGEKLKEEIGDQSASGGTALYDSILIAYQSLQDMRKQFGDNVRYGMVVLSDGDDTAKRSPLSRVEDTLKPQEQDPTGIEIHTVCIGSDCNEAVLKKIANAGHGKYWKGNSGSDMTQIYQDIATHY